MPVTPDPEHVRPLVKLAVGLTGMKSADDCGQVFTVTDFALVVKDEYVLAARPSDDWCHRVLGSVRFVQPLPGGRQYRYLADSVPVPQSWAQVFHRGRGRPA